MFDYFTWASGVKGMLPWTYPVQPKRFPTNVGGRGEGGLNVRDGFIGLSLRRNAEAVGGRAETPAGRDGQRVSGGRRSVGWERVLSDRRLERGAGRLPTIATPPIFHAKPVQPKP